MLAAAQGRFREAVPCLQRALAAGAANGPVHRNLADALRAENRLDDACTHYQRAVELEPSNAVAWQSLGDTLAALGEIQTAIAALHRAVAIDPGLTAARWSLAMAGDADGLTPLETLLAQPDLPPHDRINVGFALAKLMDGVGRYDEAFAHVAAANSLLRKNHAAAGHVFDSVRLRDHIDRRIANCTRDFFTRMQGIGSDSDRPVFVVGMPRSGTTLVEQILASHSQVRGIGERHDIAALVTELNGHAEPDAYGAWDETFCRQLAASHIARLEGVGGGVRRVVDKTPDNLFHLAAIAVLFPAAQVIICRRDLRDICLSCHFQSFAWPVPYATDLTECARRAQQVDRLLAHFQAVLPLSLQVIQYETLVADPENETRRLLAGLGLDWEVGCLDFHRTRRTVQSASLWQVRRPLYASSVGRWRHYANHLQPLLDAFGQD